MHERNISVYNFICDKKLTLKLWILPIWQILHLRYSWHLSQVIPLSNWFFNHSLTFSVSVESTKSISLKAIIGWAAVSIICHNKMVLSHLVELLRDNWTIIGCWQFRKLSSLEELFVLLHFNHVMQFLSQCGTHFVDLSLLEFFKEDFLHQN